MVLGEGAPDGHIRVALHSSSHEASAAQIIMTEDLDEPRLHIGSAILGWIWPGLGHLKNGDSVRGRRIMGGVLGMFLLGLLVGGVDCVDRREDFWWFLPQAGNGPIAFVADALNVSLLKAGKVGELMDMTMPDGRVTRISSFKAVGAVAEVGTLFIAMGGLMNLVAVLDALRGPRRATA